jgi:hypothetical protein
VRLIVTAVTWSDRSTELTVRTTPLFRNTAISVIPHLSS